MRMHPLETAIRRAWIAAAVRVIGILGLIVIAVLVRNILLMGFAAIVIAAVLSFPINFFSKKVRRGVALFFTLILLLSGGAVLGLLVLPKLTEQVQSVSHRIPDVINGVQDWYSKVKKSGTVSEIPQGGKIADRLGSRVGTFLESGIKSIVPATKGLIEIISGWVIVFILALFLNANPKGYKDAIRSMIPPENILGFDKVYTRLNQGLRQWVGGILIAMTLMGTLTGAGLAIVGIDNWFALGILTFFGTFVPYLGAISSAIPGLLSALAQSPRHFFLACLVYLGVHIVEGYLVEPMVMKRAVQIRPAFLLLGEGALASIFGIFGIVIAAPLLTCTQIILQSLYIEPQLERGLKNMNLRNMNKKDANRIKKNDRQEYIDREYIEGETPDEISEISEMSSIPDKSDRNPSNENMKKKIPKISEKKSNLR